MPRNYQRKTGRRNASHRPQELPAKFRTGFLSGLDGRTDLAKTLRANYDELVGDMGGPDRVPHVKAALAERFVWLEAILKTIEHEMVTGGTSRAEALGRWIQGVNSLTGLARALAEGRPAVRPQGDSAAAFDWSTLYAPPKDRPDPIEEAIRLAAASR